MRDKLSTSKCVNTENIPTDKGDIYSFEDSSLFNKYVDNRGLFILLILIISIGIFVFQDYLFLNHLYLFKDIGSDSINVFYPHFVHVSEYLRSEGIPKWSFNQGMGQNIFPFSLGEPFKLILYMLGRDYLPYGIVYVELLKIVLGGIVFCLYLRTISITQYTSIVGGLLFSFSGFMILGSGWYVFSTEAVYGALLLFSFEKLFKNNSWILFPVTIALIASEEPFHLYLDGLFLLVYAIFRYSDEKGWQIKGLSILFLKISGLGLLGIAISSVFFIGNVIQITEGPRVGGDASYFNKLISSPVFGFADPVQYVTAVMRFFSNDLLGTGSMFRGWNNYLEAPIFYSGLINLFLAPQIFTFLDKRQKILYSALVVLCILPIVFPFFRYAFWLFTGDYYRAFSFFVALAMLFYSLRALSYIDRFSRVNLVLLVSTSAVLLGLLYYPYLPGVKDVLIDKGLRSPITIFLIIYAILIYLLSFRKIKLFVQIAILITICIELAFFSSITVNKRSVITSSEFNQKKGYNDYTNDAVAYLSSLDRSFYRINKDYFSGPAIHASINDAKVQNYKGTPSYHSFNQKNYIKFLQETNIIRGDMEHETRWAPGLIYRPLLQTFASVKYNLSKSDMPAFLKYGYASIAKIRNVEILKNVYYLPLGFTYDSYVTASDFQKLSSLQKDIVLLKAFVIDETENERFQDFALLDLRGTANNFTFEQYGKLINDRRKGALEITEHGQNVIRGTISVEAMKLLFFSIPYDKGWSARVDGMEAELELVNIGFMGLLLDRGDHTVELEFKPPYLVAGTIISVVSLLLYSWLVWFYYCKKNK